MGKKDMNFAAALALPLLLAAGAAAQGQPAAPAAPPAPAVSSAPVSSAVAVSSEAPAGAPTLAVENLVSLARQYSDENEKGITPEEKARRLAAKGRINGILDLHEMARLILIRKWNALKPAEREKYADLLSALVQKVGYPQIGSYFNENLEVKYDGEKLLPDGNAEVATSIVYKDEDLTLSTEFRLHDTPKGWRIYDVVTDGESLLLIYRNQHMGIIKDKGFPELIRLMEKKLHED